jgi:FkbM family methyltransferase
MQKFDWRADSYPMFINLDHREDRRQHIKEQLERVGIKADRVRGVYFHEVEDSKNPKYKTMVDSCKNQLGCYTAHINCLERAYKVGSSALIFEDDAYLCEDFLERMDYIQNFLNNNEWDVVWFGGTYHLEPTWHDLPHTNSGNLDCTCTKGVDVERTDDPRIVRTYGCWSTAGYLVNYNSIPKILHMLEEVVHRSTAIDHSFIMIEPFTKTFAMIPALMKQIDNHSDNYDNINKFSDFAHLGRQWYADKMEDVDPSSIVIKKKNKKHMLIPISKLVEYHKPKNVLHIGAHLGEEVDSYYNHGADYSVWVEANEDLMRQLQSNISRYRNARALNAVLTDVDDKDVVFNISNNGMSSSILDLEHHKIAHPEVVYVGDRLMKSRTLNTLLTENNIPVDLFDFMNIDIQGAELLMLKGATNVLPHIKCIYCEVNQKEVYKDCPMVDELDEFLLNWGFVRVETEWCGDTGWGDAIYMKAENIIADVQAIEDSNL